MFKKILVPLDGSVFAEQAAGRAATIARASNASIDLVLVHAPTFGEQLHAASWESIDSDAAYRYLESIARELATGAGVSVTHALRRGDPVHHICARATDGEADLIVMTSHGRTGLSRLWFGSVADGVMRHATVPVLVLAAVDDQRQRGAAHPPFAHVLVPLDGMSMDVVPHAVALAQCGHSRVTLLRVVQPTPQIVMDAGVPYGAISAVVDSPATKVLAETVEGQLRDEASRLQDQTGLQVDSRVVVDASVGNAIVAFAHSVDADVIAMATQASAVERTFLGSVADKVARDSRLPVLLYHPQPAATNDSHALANAGDAGLPFVVI